MKLTRNCHTHGQAICRMTACLMATVGLAVAHDALGENFLRPPDEAKPRVYWWWLNNLVSQQGITRDLEQFKAKGIGGVLLFNAGAPAGAMPSGPDFMSPAWREMVKHALAEAARLGLEVSINLCSGWDAGGPWITDETASHHYVQTELAVNGPQKFQAKIPLPPGNAKAYRDVAVQAFRMPEGNTIASTPIPNVTASGSQKDLLAIKAARASAFDMGSIRAAVQTPLGPSPFDPKLPAIDPASVVDLTGHLQSDGTLVWDVPAGKWTIVRTGYTTTGRAVSCSTKGGEGPEMDWLDASAMDLHFKSMAGVLLDDSASLIGKSLKYLHDDSWEVGLPNWTSNFLADFKKYRGYDALPYLPALAGHTVGSSEISDRFLYDLRKTIADCLAENHYARFAELAHARGLAIHPESGGPCCPEVVPMDALKNLGRGDIPMGEFWQSEHWHEGTNQNTNGKQTATAAHIYGKRWVMAEAFTSIGPHWQEGPAELKPTADIAFCEGINRFVHHTATSTRPEDGKPGYEYFAGTHFNPNITWWDQAGAWTSYISRCQWLLSQGLFVADVCYYNGDWAPNLVEPKHLDPGLGKGYDYDVCNAEVLLTRMSVKDGRIVLPDGMSYRVLALPEHRAMPLEVLKKIKQLVEAGATVVGPRPEKDPGLRDYPGCDDAVRLLAAEVWGDCDGSTVTERSVGKGRIAWGKSLREVLSGSKVAPDFDCLAANQDTFIDFIHRRDGEAEIYFVANRLNREQAARCTFRVAGKQPELWDPITGSMRKAMAFAQADGRTTVPLDFAPHGSTFVIFRKPIPGDSQGSATSNSPRWSEPVGLNAGWTVKFDPAWGGPESANFENLCDWSKSAQDAIRYYSGTASYHYEPFSLPPSMIHHPQSSIYLDLGDVKNLAEVTLNGQKLGVLWTRPFRVEISGALKPKNNLLEIRVTNLWPNRLIGDASLPPDKRLTRTNVSSFKKTDALLPSGLLGPVRMMMAE